MNRQERDRILASLTDDELAQLRERMSRSEDHGASNRRFAGAFFSGSADDQDSDGASDYTEEQRQWARELFAPDDPDAKVIAGLPEGRSVSRTTPPRREPIPRNEFRFS